MRDRATLYAWVDRQEKTQAAFDYWAANSDEFPGQNPVDSGYLRSYTVRLEQAIRGCVVRFGYETMVEYAVGSKCLHGVGAHKLTHSRLFVNIVLNS